MSRSPRVARGARSLLDTILEDVEVEGGCSILRGCHKSPHACRSRSWEVGCPHSKHGDELLREGSNVSPTRAAG
eukprot:746579-Hanusia_phi.AAC.1